MMRAGDRAWEKIFRALEIDPRKSVTYVTADQIKAISGREPRNMAYMDSRESLPRVFRDNGLFLLPVSNGRYAVIRGDGFHDLEAITNPTMTHTSDLRPLRTLSARTSESQNLDYAYNTGLLSAVTDARDLHPTIRGRKHSPKFAFMVGNVGPLQAEGVQYEVDSGYETDENIILIEAKAVTSKSFIIRQLYYPYRAWSTIVPELPVRTYFFVSHPGKDEYCFWEYAWTDPQDYSSISLRSAHRYSISVRPVPPKEYAKITPARDLSRIIPQADDTRKLEEFPFVISRGLVDSQSVAEYFEFNPRQSSYYRQATEVLGLALSDDKEYRLTPLGEKFTRLDPVERRRTLARQALRVPLINEILQRALTAGEEGLSKDDIRNHIAAWAKEHSLQASGATLGRRADTIFAWFKAFVPVVEVEGRGESKRLRVPPR